MNRSIYEHLVEDLTARLPMHMPGHKRNDMLAPYLKGLGAALDITEIQGFDNLRAPEGMLRDAMERAAALYGAHRSFFLVGGSTAGILAGIRALAGEGGGEALIQRNSHLSVYNGLVLCRLQPAYIPQGWEKNLGIYYSPGEQGLLAALKNHPRARLVVLTSPGYEGLLADLPALVGLAHRAGVPVLVDAAHGAHLGPDGRFPAGAVQSGADIVVHSLHKTLPSLTQTALAHARTESVAQRLEEQLNVFQTSSPSYLLLASIDGCIRLLADRGPVLYGGWLEALQGVKEGAKRLRYLRLWQPDEGAPYGIDPGKLVIDCSQASIGGEELADRLLREAGIDLEMAASRYALAMTGMGDTAQSMDRLLDALLAVDGQLHAQTKECLPAPFIPSAHMPHYQALCSPWERVSLQQAKGRTAAEYLMRYPPGAPFVVPGEHIEASVLDEIGDGHSLLFTRTRLFPGQIAVLR